MITDFSKKMSMAITESLTVAELKNIARFHNLDHSGEKIDIFSNIESFCRDKNIQKDSNGLYLMSKNSFAFITKTTCQGFIKNDLNLNETRKQRLEQYLINIKKIEQVPADGFQSLFEEIDQIEHMHGITDEEKNFILGTKISWGLLTRINYRKEEQYAETKKHIEEFYGETWEMTQHKINNFEKLSTEPLVQAVSRFFILLSKPNACFHSQHIRQKAKILNQIFKRIMRETFYKQFFILWVAGDDISNENYVVTCIKKLNIVIPIVGPECRNCQTYYESNDINENNKIRKILETLKEYELKFSAMKEKIEKYESQMEKLMSEQAAQIGLQLSKLLEKIEEFQVFKIKSQRKNLSCDQTIRYCNHCCSYTHNFEDCWSKHKQNQKVNLKQKIIRRNSKYDIKCYNCFVYGHKMNECHVKIRRPEIGVSPELFDCDAVKEILPKRKSDILRLVSHIQYIDQNDPKLLERLFFEIEKLSHLYSMSEQEMRDIVVVKISGTILAKTNYRNQNFNEMKKSLLSNKINLIKKSSSSTSAKKLLCPKIMKIHHKATSFLNSYQELLPIDNNWNQENFQSKEKDGKSNNPDYKFVSKLNLRINNKLIKETIYKEKEQTIGLQYLNYCSSIQAVPPELHGHLHTEYTKKLQDQKSNASQKEQDPSRFTKWKAKNNLYRNYSHNFGNV